MARGSYCVLWMAHLTVSNGENIFMSAYFILCHLLFLFGWCMEAYDCWWPFFLFSFLSLTPRNALWSSLFLVFQIQSFKFWLFIFILFPFIKVLFIFNLILQFWFVYIMFFNLVLLFWYLSCFCQSFYGFQFYPLNQVYNFF